MFAAVWLKLSVQDSLSDRVGLNWKSFAPPPNDRRPGGSPPGGWACDGGGATGGVHGGIGEVSAGAPGKVGAGIPKGWVCDPGPWNAGGYRVGY